MKTMKPDVYEGGGGDLVICQEWPSIEAEHYVRIIIPISAARELAANILAVADRAEYVGLK